MLGLSDFASKGEQCDACVCAERPSGRGSAEDLCSGTWARLGGVFPLVLPYSARTCLEHRLRPLRHDFQVSQLNLSHIRPILDLTEEIFVSHFYNGELSNVLHLPKRIHVM